MSLLKFVIWLHVELEWGDQGVSGDLVLVDEMVVVGDVMIPIMVVEMGEEAAGVPHTQTEDMVVVMTGTLMTGVYQGLFFELWIRLFDDLSFTWVWFNMLFPFSVTGMVVAHMRLMLLEATSIRAFMKL